MGLAGVTRDSQTALGQPPRQDSTLLCPSRVHHPPLTLTSQGSRTNSASAFLTLLSSFLSFPLLPSFLGLMGAPLPQRPGLETGVELAGATGVSTAEDVVASWRKIRSLRRRFHRSSSLASSPNSKLRSLGDLNFFSLRPFSDPSLALSVLPDPESRLLGAWLGGMLLASSGPFFPRSSPEGDFFLILISLSESVYSNSVPRCKGFNHQSKQWLSQEGPHPAGSFWAPWEMSHLFNRALACFPFQSPHPSDLCFCHIKH